MTTSDWYPDLIHVTCIRCGDASLGPWVPLLYGYTMCEVCWLLVDGSELLEWMKHAVRLHEAAVPLSLGHLFADDGPASKASGGGL